MNRSETVDFIKNLIEEAMEEAQENGTDNQTFIPNCNKALEFLEMNRKAKKEYRLVRLNEEHCREAAKIGAVYMPWQIEIKIADWLYQPVKVFKTPEEALEHLNKLQKEDLHWD